MYHIFIQLLQIRKRHTNFFWFFMLQKQIIQKNAQFFHFLKLQLFDTVARVICCTFVYKNNLPEIGNKAKAERRERPYKDQFIALCVCVS